MLNKDLMLNDYQQLMLRISDLVPYNAVHTVTFVQELNREQIQEAVNRVVHSLGLGSPAFSEERQSVRFLPLDHPIPVTCLSYSLTEHTRVEMNTPFALHALPLRFFILTSESRSYLSVTYNHWIADGYSIIRLIDAIFLTLSAHALSPLTLQAPTMKTCFPNVYGKKILYYRLISLLKSIIGYSGAYRSPICDVESAISGCCYDVFADNVLPRLLQICKIKQITLNDLFITILAKVFGDLTLEQRKQLKSKFWKPKRERIVISVIANIRKQSSIPLTDTFGLFLGFFSIFMKQPERYSFEQAHHLVAKQTCKFKRHHTALKQSVAFKIQNKLWDKARSLHSKYRIFSKSVPITVGISNLSLNGDLRPTSDLYNDYVRCSPTAIVCPIVFNITSQHEHLSLAITYRKTCYTDIEALAIRDQFIQCVQDLVCPQLLK